MPRLVGAGTRGSAPGPRPSGPVGRAVPPLSRGCPGGQAGLTGGPPPAAGAERCERGGRRPSVLLPSAGAPEEFFKRGFFEAGRWKTGAGKNSAGARNPARTVGKLQPNKVLQVKLAGSGSFGQVSSKSSSACRDLNAFNYRPAPRVFRVQGGEPKLSEADLSSR